MMNPRDANQTNSKLRKDFDHINPTYPIKIPPATLPPTKKNTPVPALVVLCLSFTACQANSRMYVNHTEGPYSIADDTLIIQNVLIINRSGFQKIRHGQRLPKQYQVKQWKPDGIDAPVISVSFAAKNHPCYLIKQMILPPLPAHYHRQSILVHNTSTKHYNKKLYPPPVYSQLHFRISHRYTV
jgi:hypothetical protein